MCCATKVPRIVGPQAFGTMAPSYNFYMSIRRALLDGELALQELVDNTDSMAFSPCIKPTTAVKPKNRWVKGIHKSPPNFLQKGCGFVPHGSSFVALL